MSTVPVVAIEEPVSMCRTFENNYWARGHIDKTKFRGALLSSASSGALEGEEEPRDILAGKVKYGWIATVAGDWSGCGGDYSIYFLDTKPETEFIENPEDYFDDWDDESKAAYIEEIGEPGRIIDVHEATWWEPAR
jgi:hypothetical protein